MRRETQGQVQLISEIHNGGQEFVDFTNEDMYGGLCAAFQPSAAAGDNTTLAQFDVNSLYPAIMAEKMPVGDIIKIDVATEEARKLITDWRPDDHVGYAFDINLHIPPELHDEWDLAPFARLDSDPTVLSKKQQETFKILKPTLGSRLVPFL